MKSKAENPLKEWYRAFTKKRAEIIERNHLKKPEEIAEYFTYKNMRKREPDFCPLYKTGERCHEVSEEELNCFFCGCPFYDYDLWDEEHKKFGGCKINSPYGMRNEYGYWDCTKCLIPHRSEFVINAIKRKIVDLTSN